MILLTGLVLYGCKGKEKADLIVYNALVHTVDGQMSKADGFAIRDGKFLEVGDGAALLEKYESVAQLDMQRKTIVPGFVDAHTHLIGLAERIQQADLREAMSMEGIVEQLEQYKQKYPDRQWLVGWGWDQNKWTDKTMPTKKLLDEKFPNVAVVLKRIDGHAVLVNQKALDLAGITAQTTVSGGSIELQNGKLTGLLLEDPAFNLVLSKLPQPNDTEWAEMLFAAQKKCLEVGLTTISEAGLDKKTVDLLEKLEKENKLKLRIYAMLNPTDENKKHYLAKGPYNTGRVNVRSFKVYADGALGSRGACLLAPYSDKPDTRGVMQKTPKELEDLYNEIAPKGFQINTHCIGDSAVRAVLDIYGKILKGTNDKRWRIEHAQVVHPQDINKFKQFSVLASVQPQHVSSDWKWAKDRLGPDRVKYAYVFKDLMVQNGQIAFGSDFPVVPENPIYTFHAAVSRTDENFEPDGGYMPEQIMDKPTALKALTIWSAFANFEEKDKGSIEAGKFADFVVLDTDILDTDNLLLRNTMILRTFINGEEVYKNEQ